MHEFRWQRKLFKYQRKNLMLYFQGLSQLFLCFSLLCYHNVHQQMCFFNKTIFRLADKALYEDCQVDEQCRDKPGGGVCRQILHRKMCLCDDGYIEDRESLKFRKG